MIYDSIDDKSLNRSLWILKNVSKIRFTIKFLLFALVTVIYLYLFYNIYMLIISNNQHIEFYNYFYTNNQSNNENIIAAIQDISPMSLVIKDYGATTGFSKIYFDFYSFIENPNEKYKVESFDYYFTFDGEDSAVNTSFIPINSSKYVFTRGINGANSSVNNVGVVIKNIKWKLVDLYPTRANRSSDSNIPYNCEIISEDITIDNETIKNTKSGSKSVNTFSFDVYNNSLNNYKTINNKIIFFNRSGNVSYIYEKNVENLRYKNVAIVSINLPDYLDDFGSVLVIPEVDLCREESYMPKDIINTGV